ncbi:hypothetical protein CHINAEXTREME_20435 (plasmid) [Halobiforma lacisalsi AJ5]|uniref:HEAT repeat domain-containing protein n=2 Tax=Natronobacterium lacisalsi TaxID=229731 RepID=A0A1P8LWQ3_NATLA|nr:hypothetical protein CHINAEXTREME_20435 [Halobiforma lacisalsi AJ5]
MRLYGPISYILLVGVLFLLLSLVLALFELTLEITLPPTIALSVMVLAGVPNLHGRYLAKKDAKEAKKLEGLIANPAAGEIDTAIENLAHRQERVNKAALRAAADILEDSPGKAIKYSSTSAESIYTELVRQVQSGDEETKELALKSLLWISRDHGHLPYQHAKLYSNLLQVTHSPIQIYSTLILGNIKLEDQSQYKACAKAIKPVVQDPDAEVRKAAATALGNLPCDVSLKLLNHLAKDSDRNVRHTANEALQHIR